MLKDEIERKYQLKKKRIESVELTCQTHNPSYETGITLYKKMLKDELERKYQLKKKRIKSVELTCQTHNPSYETRITLYKANQNKL